MGSPFLARGCRIHPGSPPLFSSLLAPPPRLPSPSIASLALALSGHLAPCLAPPNLLHRLGLLIRRIHHEADERGRSDSPRTSNLLGLLPSRPTHQVILHNTDASRAQPRTCHARAQALHSGTMRRRLPRLSSDRDMAPSDRTRPRLLLHQHRRRLQTRQLQGEP